VLKKAGIIVATSAAGILAFTPLAFAGSSDHDANKHYGKGHEHSKVETNDVSEGNLTNDCAFGNQGGSPTAGALGGSSLLGVASPVTSLAADVTSQLNTLNCNNVNVSDLVDNDSNNRRSTESQTHVDDSFNNEGHH
jgi:hypothetical protein